MKFLLVSALFGLASAPLVRAETGPKLIIEGAAAAALFDGLVDVPTETAADGSSVRTGKDVSCTLSAEQSYRCVENFSETYTAVANTSAQPKTKVRAVTLWFEGAEALSIFTHLKGRLSSDDNAVQKKSSAAFSCTQQDVNYVCWQDVTVAGQLVLAKTDPLIGSGTHPLLKAEIRIVE